MLYSFVAFLILFVAIGIASSFFSKKTTSDYLLANKDVNPWLVGLSIFATENSGFMFVGFVGLAYKIGLMALWIPIGWYLGEFMALWLTSKRIRVETDNSNAQTYNSLISQWGGRNFKYVGVLSALITVVFLSVYASAQLSASGKALYSLVGWDLNTSVIIGAVVVVFYCFFGGLRASIWTDAVQTVTMIVSLVLLMVFAVAQIGGWADFYEAVQSIEPSVIDMMSGSYKFGIFGFIAGWFFAGVGILGQPHAMIRVMVIDKPDNLKKALLLYIALAFVLASLCIVTALCARVLIPDLLSGDPELALPLLSKAVLPDILSGVFLAGLFSAALSTADSQILSSSSALSQNIFTKFKDNVIFSRLLIVLIGAVSLSIAFYGDKNVLSLALYSWSVMASSMGVLLFIYALGWKISQAQALLTMVAGLAGAVAWKEAGLSGDMYAAFPGMICALIMYFVSRLVLRTR